MHSVLLVDDDDNITTALSWLLEEHDIPVSIANDVGAATSMLESQFFAIVLSDLRMRGDRDGMQLIEAVRRMSPRTKVAAMTGYATPDVEQSLRNLGAAAILHKPFEADEFLRVIRELLADAGNPEDLSEVYRVTTPRLRAMLARRYKLSPTDCEDIVQQAWCVLLEKHGTIRESGPWLAGTMCNLAKQLLERRSRELLGEPPDVRSIERDLDASIAIRDALQRLDVRSRRLCELVGIDRLSYAEASAALDLPLGSVGPLFIRAKQRLRRELTH